MHQTVVIVAVILKEQDKYLLVQEAKEDCRGKWYLPAGKLEREEDLVDAAKREVQEEAGFICEPTGIFNVEFHYSGGYIWQRFAITGSIKSGKLKTLEEADEESLQANWFTKEEIIDMSKKRQLRANDFLSLLDLYDKNAGIIPI